MQVTLTLRIAVSTVHDFQRAEVLGVELARLLAAHDARVVAGEGLRIELTSLSLGPPRPPLAPMVSTR